MGRGDPDFPTPALIEHAGGLGFDVAFIDCEHGSAGFETAEHLARAARAAGMTSILRPWSNEPGLGFSVCWAVHHHEAVRMAAALRIIHSIGKFLTSFVGEALLH